MSYNAEKFRKLLHLGLTKKMAVALADDSVAGGGMSSNGDENWIEIASPQTPTTALWSIDWTAADTGGLVSVGAGGGSFHLAESGVYALAAYVTFADPAQETHVNVSTASGRVIGFGVLKPGLSSREVSAVGVVRSSLAPQGYADMQNLGLLVRFSSLTGSPVWPVITDAYVGCDKLVDA